MNQRRHIVTTLAASALLVFASAAAAKKHDSHSASGAQGFAVAATESNIAVIRMADLAQTKTSSQAVKSLAQRLATDHAKANAELKQIAETKNIALPNKMNAKDQAEFEKLSKLSGAEFDKAYTRAAVAGHKDVISQYRHEAEHGTDPALKQYAASTLPTFEHNLELAKSAKSAVSKSM